MDYTALASELTTDPMSRGYSGMTDQEAADDLNTLYRTENRPYVDGSEILNATDDSEFGALTDAQQDRWLSLCGVDTIDTSSGVAKDMEADLFGAGTQTRSNLQDIRKRNISRAQELGFENLTVNDVTYARSL